MDMIDSHIQTTYTYNEEVAKQIARDIVQRYYDRFKKLRERLEKLRTDE
jgi:hypothetical protein